MTFWTRALAVSGLLLSLTPRCAFATTNQQLSVSGDVVADCTTAPSSGSLAFGTYNPFSTSDLKPAPFSFSINCTQGDTSLSVAVDGGANYTSAAPSGDRAMKDGSGHYLTYQIYTDNTYATAWPFSTSTGTGTAISLRAGGINSANQVALYGVLPNGQTTGTDAGSYSDTVHVTVNY